jgi:hypothetical protein
VRDLAHAEPWLESRERSIARRGKGTRSSAVMYKPAPGRRVRTDDQLVQKSSADWLGSGPGTARRSAIMLVSAGLTLLAAIAQTLLDGGRARASAALTRANVPHATDGSQPGHSVDARFGAGLVTERHGCQRVVSPSVYVNPLAAASVIPERVDQGVDYAGSGTLIAVGSGRVSYVGTSNTGWPGAFIEYRLVDGPNRGCYVYYAEGVTPAPGLRVGVVVSAGERIATIIPHYPTGIELGWSAGAGTKTYAAKMGEWTADDDADSVPSAAGRSFSALIASLGGPPGKVEGDGKPPRSQRMGQALNG